MAAAVHTQEMMRLTLASASDHAALAAGLLVAHLGLSPVEAAFRLAAAPSVLAEAAPLPVARRLAALLGALGLSVRTEPVTCLAPAQRVDVALQTVDILRAPVLRLSRLLGLPPDVVLAGLAMPEGLVLSQSMAEAEALRRALRRERALRIVVSDPATAQYDLFLARAMPVGLPRALHRLGLRRCGFSGAVAAALDQRMAAHLTARHAGVFALNRDFQRFDLYLVAAPGVPVQQLADFLATRSVQPRARLTALLLAAPLQIETGLTRAVARQFTADYSAIGLETRVRLSLPAAAVSAQENP